MHLVGLLYEGGQEGSQVQQLTGAVPRVELQVEVCQPTEKGKSLSRGASATEPDGFWTDPESAVSPTQQN